MQHARTTSNKPPGALLDSHAIKSLALYGYCHLPTTLASKGANAELFAHLDNMFSQRRSWLEQRLATEAHAFLGFRPAGYEKSLLHQNHEPCEQFKIGYYLEPVNNQEKSTAGNALALYNPLHNDMIVSRYWHHIGLLAAALFEHMAKTAGIPAQSISKLVQHPFHQLGLNHYRGCTRQRGDMLMGSHSDASLLTIILPSARGLQIEGPQGNWRELPPVADSVIVLVGQFLATLSEGYYCAPLHRVIDSTGSARYSLVYKYRANRLARVSLGNGDGFCPGELYERKLQAIMH